MYQETVGNFYLRILSPENYKFENFHGKALSQGAFRVRPTPKIRRGLEVLRQAAVEAPTSGKCHADRHVDLVSPLLPIDSKSYTGERNPEYFRITAVYFNGRTLQEPRKFFFALTPMRESYARRYPCFTYSSLLA